MSRAAAVTVVGIGDDGRAGLTEAAPDPPHTDAGQEGGGLPPSPGS
jgi:hypothetical protein